MSPGFPELQIGRKVGHPELGEGVVVGFEPKGFVRVFFRSLGERQVPVQALQETESWSDRIIAGLKPVTPEALERLWLAIEAAELPLMESVATLISAKVDLFPHQVVLVHRVANARPRRFLIAVEVGLGKTIETALILRELASRGEMRRALMVVPARLVDNWRRELNEVFNLDFEVFGAEGDVTDQKSNAFAKHNRLIVSWTRPYFPISGTWLSRPYPGLHTIRKGDDIQITRLFLTICETGTTWLLLKGIRDALSASS